MLAVLHCIEGKLVQFLNNSGNSLQSKAKQSEENKYSDVVQYVEAICHTLAVTGGIKVLTMKYTVCKNIFRYQYQLSLSLFLGDRSRLRPICC